jgi:hypothetical protein
MTLESTNINLPLQPPLLIADVSSSILLNTGTCTKFILPLEMRWQPKEDITTYELAKCLPYLFRYNGTMPYEIDKTEIHFRHFEIIDHNG